MEDQRAPRVNIAQFGDGAMQRSRDGINHNPETITLKWEHLTEVEATDIMEFFDDRGGNESFNYTLPWYASGNTLKVYICLKYGRHKESANDYMITAEWKEVFEE
jgi:phage-related protein